MDIPPERQVRHTYHKARRYHEVEETDRGEVIHAIKKEFSTPHGA